MDCLLGWDPATDQRFPESCKPARDACVSAEKALRQCESKRGVPRREWTSCTK